MATLQRGHNLSQDEKCYACGRKLGKSENRVDTRDDQTVFVGRECFKMIQKAGEAGYQPPEGGPRLWAMKINLKVALKQFGRHRSDCGFYFYEKGRVKTAESDCTCGLSAALGELREPVQAGCSCPTECDCQNPEPKDGVALVSEECPIHNVYPQPSLTCPVHGEPKTA